MRDSGCSRLVLNKFGDGHRLAAVPVAAAAGRAGHRDEIGRCSAQAFHDLAGSVQRELTLRREHLHREGDAPRAALGHFRAGCASLLGYGHAPRAACGQTILAAAFENAGDGFHEQRVSFLVRISCASRESLPCVAQGSCASCESSGMSRAPNLPRAIIERNRPSRPSLSLAG